jgi:hypothetical protein
MKMVQKLAGMFSLVKKTFRFYQGSPSSKQELLSLKSQQAQTLMPYQNDGSVAMAEFSPEARKNFSLADGSITSDSGDLNANNPGEKCTSVHCGKFFRYFPVKGPDGVAVPNAVLVWLDYPEGNFDFNDNSWILWNVNVVPF